MIGLVMFRSKNQYPTQRMPNAAALDKWKLTSALASDEKAFSFVQIEIFVLFSKISENIRHAFSPASSKIKSEVASLISQTERRRKRDLTFRLWFV